MPDPTPDLAARRMRAVLLMLTIAVIAYFAFTGGSDRGAELSVAGAPGTAPTSAPAATSEVAGVSVQSTEPPATARIVTTVPSVAPTAAPTTATAGTDPLVFRNPLNGKVNVTLEWDCYDCVDWPTLRNKHHPAVDYLSSDTNIVATADGVVVKMNTGCGGQGCGNSLGNWLFLKHTLTDGSTLFSFYAHMAEIAPAVTQGACIKTGQKVGVIGNTGIAGAAHLHFSIQTNTNLLDYTSVSSATFGSINPDTLYGKTKVKSC
ncbi:MAG TPA: M23 family metallopeptidase [Acidimicrobiales bacterium]|nr:M23 family metallopeptidase [Acidimicrobiales bacterium]